MAVEWAALADKEKAELAYRAISSGEAGFITVALEDKAFLNRRNVFPLHIAVEYDKTEAIEIILGLGYPVNKANTIQGSALQWAIRRRKYKSAVLLINEGASLTWRNQNKENALSMAARYGDDAFVKFIFRKRGGLKGRS